MLCFHVFEPVVTSDVRGVWLRTGLEDAGVRSEVFFDVGSFPRLKSV